MVKMLSVHRFCSAKLNIVLKIVQVTVSYLFDLGKQMKWCISFSFYRLLDGRHFKHQIQLLFLNRAASMHICGIDFAFLTFLGLFFFLFFLSWRQVLEYWSSCILLCSFCLCALCAGLLAAINKHWQSKMVLFALSLTLFFGVESYQWLKNWHSSGYPYRRLAL